MYYILLLNRYMREVKVLRVKIRNFIIFFLGIGDWGLGPNPQSPIPNPQSPTASVEYSFDFDLVL
jgi:hypothetical protein